MVPWHPCLKLISNCEQKLSSHTARRLITMEKVKEFEVCCLHLFFSNLIFPDSFPGVGFGNVTLDFDSIGEFMKKQVEEICGI